MIVLPTAIDPSDLPSSTSKNAKAASLESFRIGGLLGSGSFSSVYEVHPKHHGILDCCKGETSDVCSCLHRRYALKRLSDSTLAHPETFAIASADLAYEAELLLRLPRHENLVQLYGLSDGFFDKPESGFFIVQCLNVTLDDKLKHWRKQRREMWLWKHLFARQDRHVEARVNTAGVGIAKALRFLHSHQILYRDLKPANVGYDSSGNVCLFDFGLARPTDSDSAGGNFTRCVGCPRYMSPEVSLGTAYGSAADVHSFAILLWEICTLDQPFSQIRTLKQLTDFVHIARNRPSLKKIRSNVLRGILKSAWDPKPECRPSMGLIVSALQPKNCRVEL